MDKSEGQFKAWKDRPVWPMSDRHNGHYAIEDKAQQPQVCHEKMRGDGRRQLRTTPSGFTYPEARRRG